VLFYKTKKQEEKMSIEESFSRIASALEKIADNMSGGPVDPAPTRIDAPGINSPKTSIIPPMAAPTAKAGIGGFVPPTTPVVPVATATVTPAGTDVTAIPASPEELRTLAQKIAAKAGKKVLPFTEAVNGIIAPLGITALTAVPKEHIVDVTKKILAWADKEGIKV
jgi:hypothetical protein